MICGISGRKRCQLGGLRGLDLSGTGGGGKGLWIQRAATTRGVEAKRGVLSARTCLEWRSSIVPASLAFGCISRAAAYHAEAQCNTLMRCPSDAKTKTLCSHRNTPLLHPLLRLVIPMPPLALVHHARRIKSPSINKTQKQIDYHPPTHPPTQPLTHLPTHIYTHIHAH